MVEPLLAWAGISLLLSGVNLGHHIDLRQTFRRIVEADVPAFNCHNPGAFREPVCVLKGSGSGQVGDHSSLHQQKLAYELTDSIIE